MLQTLPPVTHQEMGGAVKEDEVVPVPHNRDDVDESESIVLPPPPPPYYGTMQALSIAVAVAVSFQS